jgi:phytoene synthase
VGGFPTHPISIALRWVLERYRVPIGHLEVLIQGVEMDLEHRRYATFDDLQVYCEHVASAVGLISIRIFGCRHPAAERYARALGIALQLTNILRDLKTDDERGRIYLPQAELTRFGYSEADLAQGRISMEFRRLMEFQCERARGFYREAEEALQESGEEGRLLSARIMGAIYARLLKRIEDLRYDVFSHRVAVPRHEQLWIAARTWLTPSPLASPP